MELSRYLKIWPHPGRPDRLLVLATRRCAVVELSPARLEAARRGGLPEADRETLARLGVLVADRDRERQEVRRTFDLLNAAGRRCAALVTLTLDCNLVCSYCFEDPFRGRLAMDDATAALLVERLTKQMAAGRDVAVDFYGGEALLALPLLRRLAVELQGRARSQGVAFSFTIFTNGTLLTRAIAAELLPLGLTALRLTLDGPRELHDRQRPYVSGRGSFDTILANLLAVHDLVPVDLGGNYTRDNWRRFPELLDGLLAAGVDPARFKAVGFSPVMPRADGSCAGDPASCAGGGEPWLAEAALVLRAETLRRGFPVPRLTPGACMVEFEHSLVVGYDGGLYKCPVFMGDPAMRVGTLADGVGDYRASHNLAVWHNDTCGDCPYLPLCFGGCRFLRRARTGAVDGVTCDRVFFDATLERFVLQDLGLDPAAAAAPDPER